MVHDIYAEMVRIGYDLRELYDYSLKELLFILKYRREGLAYVLWRQGTMTRAASCKQFPSKDKEAMPELFEKQTVKMPDWLKDDYAKKLESTGNFIVKRGE